MDIFLKLDFSNFNPPTKTLIRQLFVGQAKNALGRVRGKFSGTVGPPQAERTMDYETLVSEGNEERANALQRLDERLLRLGSEHQLERAANEAEFLNKHLQSILSHAGDAKLTHAEPIDNRYADAINYLFLGIAFSIRYQTALFSFGIGLYFIINKKVA